MRSSARPTSGFTAVRHEAGGVVAADAYHRAGGGLAAATATYGAGFTNTLTALAEAVQAHVPLVLVVGDEPTSGRRPWGVDQIALASAVGARTYTVGRTDAAATTVIAIEHALTYRVPTVLAIPYDVAALEAGPVPPAPEPRLPEPVGAPRRVRRAGDPRRRRRAGRSAAPAAAGGPRRMARRRRRSAGRDRRRDRRRHRVDRTGPRHLSARRVRSRRDGRIRRRGSDGTRRRGRRRRRVRGIAQPVHDALRRALRARHAGVPGRPGARRNASARRGLSPRGCRGRGTCDRVGARGDRRDPERMAGDGERRLPARVRPG